MPANRSPFTRIRPGDKYPLSARAYNAFLDAAEYVRKHAAETGTGRLDFPPHPQIIKIRNDSGADRSRFDVLGLDGLIFTHADNPDEFKAELPAFKGIAPAEAQHRGLWVILIDPLKPHQIGRALLTGATQAQIEVTNASHQFADIKPNDATRLASFWNGGARILWKEPGTGLKWAIIRPCDPGLAYVKGRLLSDLNSGEFSTIEPHGPGPTLTVEIYDAQPAKIPAGWKLPMNTVVDAAWSERHRQFHLLTAAACPVKQ